MFNFLKRNVMQTTHTFGILFWLKLAREKDQMAPLYARITVNGKRAEISLKKKLNTTDWDAHKGRLKGLGSESKSVNAYLDRTRSKLFECYQKLKNEDRLVTSQLVKATFLGNGEKRYALTDIIAYHNEHMKETLRWGTQKNYFTTHRYVFKFLKQKHRTENVYLSELNYQFIIDFERFLRRSEAMGNNTVMKHIERLRKLINLACKMEWLERDPFAKFKAKFVKKERDFLTEGELQAIIDKEFGIERLQLIKDLFVFSCHTGLSYGDVMALTHDDICIGIDGRQWIHSQREKTNVPVKVPLLPTALEIMDNYREHPNTERTKKVFPTISNQKLNSYLKEIADVCRIKKNLTFHVARHTFATTVMLSNGVPIETVSKLLGHTKLSTTQIYARVVETKISEDFGNLLERIGEHKSVGAGM